MSNIFEKSFVDMINDITFASAFLGNACYFVKKRAFFEGRRSLKTFHSNVVQQQHLYNAVIKKESVNFE
jgi:hypothetical protein